MQVYQTDNEGFFVGETQADESPLEPGVFLIPAGCETEPPPATVEREAVRRVNGKWQKVPDYHGVQYFDVDGKPQRMDKRGEALPVGATLERPQWAIDAEAAAAAQAAALAELTAIDMKSIRAMREYIASKADAPQFVKDHETAAQAARGKL